MSKDINVKKDNFFACYFVLSMVKLEEINSLAKLLRSPSITGRKYIYKQTQNRAQLSVVFPKL